MADGYIFRGSFRIIKMDGMFHVVFRPDADPEWFRIIASFFTYDRAYAYCDVGRMLSYDGETQTTDEIEAGTREPPVFTMPNPAAEFDVPDMVRNIMPEADAAVPPLVTAPEIDEQPDGDDENYEKPEDYHRRLREEATSVASEIAKAADAPEPVAATDVVDDEPLTDKQASVLSFLRANANHMGLLSASLLKISKGSDVPHGSISFLLETLEKKRLIDKVESGKNGGTSLFRVIQAQAA